MKRVLFCLPIFLFLAACSLSPAILPTMTSVAVTRMALTITSVPTHTPTIIPAPTLTPLPTNTPIPPTPTNIALPPTPTSPPAQIYCGNEYWPIVLGATWEFTGTKTVSSGFGTEGVTSPASMIWRVIQISGDSPYPAHFTVTDGNSNIQFHCDKTGIYQNYGSDDVMVLPPEDRLIPGQTVWEKAGQATWVNDPEIVNTSLGAFEAIPVQYSPGEAGVTLYFAPEIGLVKYAGGWWTSLDQTLVSYSVAEIKEPSAASTCGIAGIYSPTVSTDFSLGWRWPSEFDDLASNYDSSYGGRVTFQRPGVRLTASQGQTAFITFQPASGTLAVKLINQGTYKIALISRPSSPSWTQIIQDEYDPIYMVLDVDNNKDLGTGLFYKKFGDQAMTLLNNKFYMVSGEEYSIVFDLSHRWFKLYDKNGKLIIDYDLSGFWGVEYTGRLGLGDFPWWTIGAGWTDTTYPTDLLVQEVCYGNSE